MKKLIAILLAAIIIGGCVFAVKAIKKLIKKEK